MLNTPIHADTDEKKKFFTNFSQVHLSKVQERPKEENLDYYTFRLKRQFMIGERKADFDEFCEYFTSIENRLKLAKYCLREISRKCKIVEANEEKEIRKLIKRHENKEVSVDANFFCKTEYFIFATMTCLDIMALVLNDLYELQLSKRFVNVSAVYNKLKNKNDGFSKYFSTAYADWIKGFKEIRNRLTHYSIMNPVSQIVDNPKENKATYCKHAISVTLENGDEITKQLPIFFEETRIHLDKLLNEFYKKLNSVAIR